jgi:hypothetical protein
MGWSGIENGKLLELAASAQFDVLITNDRGLEYEQNVSTLPLGIIVLMVRSNTIEAIRPLYGRMHTVLQSIKPGELVKLSQ